MPLITLQPSACRSGETKNRNHENSGLSEDKVARMAEIEVVTIFSAKFEVSPGCSFMQRRCAGAPPSLAIH